jgi:rubrerythrin
MIVMDALQAGRDFAVRLARREQHIQQMIEERASLEREHAAELIELIREKEQALSTERARQQGLKTALVDLVEDLEARWDMNDSHTNPGIRHCVEQARKALRCADETGVSPMTTPPADPLPPDVEQTLRAQASDIAFDEDDFTDYVWNGFDNPVENGELQKQIELYGQRCYRLALASMTGRC